MLPLSVAMRWKGVEGRKIFCPYPQLSRLGASPRFGQLSMIVAPPGAGKTALVTDWMIKLRDNPDGEEYNVLFFSADSDRGTVGNRVGASLTNWRIDEVEKFLLEGNPAVWDAVEDVTHIGYCFDSSPSYDQIQEEVIAYALLHGRWPNVIVVDNLVDVDGDTSGYEGLAETASWLKLMASETGAAVILLHHAVGMYADAVDPLPLSAVLGKIDRPQRLILTLHRPMDGVLGISVVKNSNGPADTSGFNILTHLKIDLSRMYFASEE